MADIRINDLPTEANPTASENIAIDGTTTRKTTVQNLVYAGRPAASQSEAEAGTDANKAMTPLTVKQSIAVNAATAAQGAKADSAMQPGTGYPQLIFNVADRTALKALDTTAYKTAFLQESGREGVFKWTAANLASLVTADTLEGVYVKATAVSSSTGAWVRQHNGTILPQWYGAKGRGVSTEDDLPALLASAAYAAANGFLHYIPGGLYYVSNAFLLYDNSRTRGGGMGVTTIKLMDTAVADACAIGNEQRVRTAANTGNKNILLEDITGDCNGRRAAATYGTAVELRYVTTATLRRVEGLNGYWHCCDITSAVTSVPDNETYPYGPCSHITLEDCVWKDPYKDDAMTTHYSSNITVINNRSIMTGVQEPDDTQHGFEVDEGSRGVTILGGYSYGFSTGLQIKGHALTPAACDVTVIGYTSEACSWSFQIEHSTLRSTTGRNVTLLNCRSIKPIPHDPGVNGLYHLLLRSFDNVFVKNLHCIGDPTKTTDLTAAAVQLQDNVRNSVIDGILIEDCNRPSGAIRVASSAAEGIKIRNVHLKNCYNFGAWITSGSTGIIVEDWYAETDITTSPVSAIIKMNDSTLGADGTLVSNITGNAGYSYALIDEEVFGQGLMMPKAAFNRFQNQIKVWRKAISQSDAATGSQPGHSIGYIEGNNNLGIGEGVSYDFRVMRPDGTEYTAGGIASYKVSGTDANQAHGMMFSTKDDSGSSTRRMMIPHIGIVNAANDAAAATAGVPLQGIYRNGSVLMFRVT